MTVHQLPVKVKAKPKTNSVNKRVIWSPDRPQKPDTDPMLGDLRAMLLRDKRSYYAKANLSGLSPSTIANIEKAVTRRPQALTIQMAWSMLGYVVKPVKRG